jgi:hypothetical protein
VWGRPPIPLETYLRMMFLKHRYRLGYETLCREVADSISWTRFCRIPLGERVPHPSTLGKTTARCGPQVVEELNRALLAKAGQARVIKTDTVRADTAHLIRLAGRFARRVRAWAGVNGVPVIVCKSDERKHRIAEDYLAAHTVGTGMFLVLVARAPATVWKVSRSAAGVIRHLEKRKEFVNHYSFHIMDPVWGHLTIKMSGHPPFGAQVILTGHAYVACQAHAAGIRFAKEGNCFTRIGDPERLARVADTLSLPGTIGRLSQVIDRWIYTACLCFGLDLAEQARSGFAYSYSVYQVEYSRNLIFASGAVMERVFDTIVDRTRTRLDVPKLRTLFGVGHRPHRAAGADLSPRQAVVIERPRWNLTVFKVHFGLLTLKGLHQRRARAALRGDRAQHPVAGLRPGLGEVPRDRRPAHRHARLRRRRLPSRRHPRRAAPAHPHRRHPGRRHRSEQDPHPRRTGRRARVGRRPRGLHGRAVRRQGADHDRAAQRRVHRPPGHLRPAQAARQTARRQTRADPPLPRSGIRGPHHRRPHRPPRPGRLHPRRDSNPRRGPKPTASTRVDDDYETLRIDMQTLFDDLGIAA